ncbi:Cytokinin riboside 5'-monophosphate phosphoribohydrolase [Arachis hypogaea]|nr:Cytokinin riboside 5'-monophosphate phosphoribohydrolase [Arachis hypogaea]
MSVVFFQRGHSWSFVLDEGVTWEPTRKAIPNSPADLEQIPEQDEFASKLVWEERLNYGTESEVAM